MPKRPKPGILSALGLLAALGLAGTAAAQNARPLVTHGIDEVQTVELRGNLRSEANVQNDRGRVDDALPLDHMQLLLQRPAETEAALVNYIDQLHDPASPFFHRWLTAAEFGADFGPAATAPPARPIS